MYVDDDTNSGSCVTDSKTECFFQVLALYDQPMVTHNYHSPNVMTQCIYFSQNYARLSISGSTLYGGLLDRRTVSQFAEVHLKYSRDYIDRGSGIAYSRMLQLPQIFQ